MPGPPRRAATPAEATTTDGSRTIWVLRDAAPVAVTVTPGLTDGRYTEVLSGDLREGDAVITDTAAGGQS